MNFVAAIFALTCVAYSTRALLNRDLSSAPILVTSTSILVAILSSEGIIYSSFALVWSNLGAIHNANENVAYISSITLLLVLTHLLFHPRRSTSRENWKRFQNSLAKMKLSGTFTAISIAAITAFSALHFYFLNKSVVWFTPIYLQMASDEALVSRGALPEFIQSSYKLIGLLCAIGMAFLVSQKRVFAATLLAIPTLWFLLYEIAGHSRYAAAFLAAMSACLLVLGTNRTSRAVAIITAIGSALTYSAALRGRNSGEHGFATLGQFFEQAFAIDGNFAIRIVTNIFEGVFNLAESFYFTSIDIPESYKYLSFSPLPSFIDGFASNWQVKAIRLDTFVPMGALGELMLFGIGYTILYFSTVVVAYICCIAALKAERYILGSLIAILFTLATFLQFTYSVRTTYRFFIICIAVYLAAQLHSRLFRPRVSRQGFRPSNANFSSSIE